MAKPVIALIIVAWLLVPTGTPDDVITWFLIVKLGPEAYVLILLAILFLMWNNDVTLKKVDKTMKDLWRKITK